MTTRRWTNSEKGKGLALPSSSADSTRKRIQASDFDFSDLVRDNAKTLIGRITNPKEKRINEVVSELPKKWALRGKVIGADLGNDCFQFCFDRDEDLHYVLLNRPYQHSNWMIVLERWEPVISSSFPSRIPFWISVKGLPLHLWHEKMAFGIGRVLGTYEGCDITATTARIHILLDAMEPLTLESVVDFPTGEEVPISFEYEGIANFCSLCKRLTHSSRHCNFNQGTLHIASSNRVSRRNSSQVNLPPKYPLTLPPAGKHSRDNGETFHHRVDRHGR
ncbi:uncharacterized protein At4g02000-like [Raphanus sativus]|uniref:Uncharacterized protein At4g02000-like n=1 Tax=Raphanus sativus TaxID=3726 RepID=A0A9W3DKB1_RAPSA|nr:uncharacterized protein At4g02000-like [Raphanus sativus]